MKTEYLFVILLVLIGFSSCEDSTSDATLELSQSTFENISSDGATLTVNITSSDSWTAASSSTACNLVPNQGTSNQSLSIVVEANLDEAERNMTVVVTSGGIKKTISISQQGREVQQQVSITITSRLFSMYYIRIKTILYNTLNKTV